MLLDPFLSETKPLLCLFQAAGGAVCACGLWLLLLLLLLSEAGGTCVEEQQIFGKGCDGLAMIAMRVDTEGPKGPWWRHRCGRKLGAVRTQRRFLD